MRHAIIVLTCATLLLACQTSEIEQTVPADEPTGAALDDGVVERTAKTGPVASVASTVGSPSTAKYSESMAGAKPGEVRGFTGADGSKVWGLMPNGETTLRQFAEYVFNKKENLGISPAEIEKIAITLGKLNGIPPDPDSKPKANSVVVCELKFFPKLLKRKGSQNLPASSTPSAPAGGSSAKKMVGGSSAPTNSGLDID
jgi:hypothetical protein